MNKRNYELEEKLYWAKKWNRSKNKILVRDRFIESQNGRYNKNTWHGRTVARNILVRWENQYNLGKLIKVKKKGNWVPKKRLPLTELDSNDILIYQEIVEDIFKDKGISKDEIAKRIQERKGQG